DADPVETAAWGVEQAKAQGRDVVIVDTAGRLHIDEQLMDELVRIRNAVKPHNILLVLDAMSGQDAVTTAQAFSEAVDYDGVILTSSTATPAAAPRWRCGRSPASRSSSSRWARNSTSWRSSTPTGWHPASLAWAT
ncbi:MAG: signal recognition particle subunit, partial [Gaiellales bacterium]|nr:signal recognition particle subunit [Gaiellales bacterium]